ncbi:MAG TPA: UDP-N-acetylmuramoyl-L-alanine--D-glutamate ligase [Capsulimonadaceae bacterium]|jgi:UDP-N-acetylmuramoylalanine--D-glutamate ligase
MEEFTNKRLAVVGMARSGLAAAEVLTARGASVTLYDGKPADELASPLAWAADHGIPARAATNRVDDCDIVVTSPGVRRTAAVLTDAVERGIPVWGEIEAAYRIARAPILAITGTNGKTTTTALLGAMTEAAGYETYLAGNIAAGEIAMPLIRAAHKANHDAVIIAEISSFQLEWAPTFRPKVAAILNIAVDHADRQTWDEYVAAKWNIFENQGEGDTAVLRSDVPLVGDRIRGWDADAPSIHSPGKTTIIQFDRVRPQPEWVNRLLIPGAHNIENAMAAFAMATAFGIPSDAIEKAATTFAGVVHRLEYVATIGGARYINNSMCTNNVAFERSLDAIPGPKIVLAGGVYKGGDMADLLDAATQSSVKRLVLFGKSGPDLEAAVRARGFERAVRVDDIAQAVNSAHALASDGDTVMLSPACASFDQFRDFEDRGDTFKRLVHALSGATG